MPQAYRRALLMVVWLGAFLSLTATSVAWAQCDAKADPYGLNCTYGAAGGAPDAEADPLPKAIGLTLNWAAGILGFIFLIWIIQAGVAWMTAGGNEERVAKAKTHINAAISGLIIIFISYALAIVIVQALSEASGTGKGPVP